MYNSYEVMIDAHNRIVKKANRYKELYESSMKIVRRYQMEREGWRARVNAALDGIEVVEKWNV